MKPLSLRWFLLWPSAIILSLGAVFLGVFVERSVQRDLVTFVDNELARALGAGGPNGGAIGGAPARPPDADDSSRPEAPLQYLIDAEGTVTGLSRGVEATELTDEVILELADTTQTVTLDTDPRYRVRTVPGAPGETVVVALSLTQVDESLASLRRNLIIGGLVLFGAEIMAIWLIAGLAARPVTAMGQVAHRIADGELDAEVVTPSGPRETADLAADLTTMLERLRTNIADKEQSVAEAHRARRDMERFMADASHELSTPLTALKGYSDLHGHGMLQGEDLDRAMARIGSESERLHRLVVELLQLVRDERYTTDVDMGAIASAVVHDVRAAHPERKISLHLPEATLVVEGDPHRLHQALLNLLANACNHTAPDTPIEVALIAAGATARLCVIDHGPGVEPAVADQLFLPFTRGDASRSRRSHDGAGLGLALVRRIAEQHGGVAAVEPTVGGGATFVLTLPLAPTDSRNL